MGVGPQTDASLWPGLGARSLEAISGLESSGRAFTMHVQGLLQLQVSGRGGGAQAWRAGQALIHRLGLQAGQYASVFVDNGSGAALTVHSGSSFSGLLLGM